MGAVATPCEGVVYPVRGNCLTYALGMLLAEGFTGRIEPSLMRGWPPKLRFYYVSASGRRTHFYPRHPVAGWAACVHAFWFDGIVKVA